MPFPRKLLNDNEEVILDLRPHWLYLAGPSLTLLAAVVLAIVVGVRTSDGRIVIPLLVLVLIALVWFLARIAEWSSTNLVITSDRLIVRTGLLTKRGREIPLERINDITVTQTLFKRLLGAGDLVIESAGERGQEAFLGCPHPGRVQNEIYHQMEAARARDADRREGKRDLSPLEQIEKLDELRQRGVISQAEFEAKKAKLLDRL